MIFCYITGTPCIAFPNTNGKVQGVFRWIENKGSVSLSSQIDNFVDVKEKAKPLSLKEEFVGLKNVVR